jgi:hypothetical protein
MRTYAVTNALGSKASHTGKRRYWNNPHSDLPLFAASRPDFNSHRNLAAPKLLLNSENRVLRRLGNSEFDDGLGGYPDLLLRLRVDTRPRFPFSVSPASQRPARRIRRSF